VLLASGDGRDGADPAEDEGAGADLAGDGGTEERDVNLAGDGSEGAEERVADGLLGAVVAADELVVLEVLRELLIPDQPRS
jgi:hypothetical protein